VLRMNAIHEINLVLLTFTLFELLVVLDKLELRLESPI
jgi:hypothetical protein